VFTAKRTISRTAHHHDGFALNPVTQGDDISFVTTLSPRIPLQIAPPKARWGIGTRHVTLLAVLGVGMVTATVTWQGSANAQRSTSVRSLGQVLGGLPTTAALVSVADIQTELNRRREHLGLSQLVFDTILEASAQGWADTLAAEGRVLHDPRLVAGYEDGWDALSEGVASGGSPDAAFASVFAKRGQSTRAFDAATSAAGIGLAEKSGQTFLVVRFVAGGS